MKEGKPTLEDSTSATSRVVDQWVAQLRPRRPSLVDETIRRIRASIPYVDHAGDGWVRPVGALLDAGIERFLDLWSDAADRTVVIELAPELLVPAETSLPSDLLRSGYRIVSEVVREHIDDLIDLDTTHDPAALLQARSAARTVEQALADAVEVRCATVTAAAARHRSVQDARIVGALLDSPVELGTATRLALEVGFDLQRPLRVAVARDEDPAADLATRLRDDARRRHQEVLAAARGNHVVLVMDAGSDVPTGAAHVGVSRPTTPEDVRQAHAEAVAALRLAVSEGCRTSRFEDRLLDHVLARVLPFEELAEELLAPAAELGPADRERMLTTLEAYLDANCSVTAAGERLHLHRESVRYRLRQIKKLWGSVLDTAEGRLTLHLAVKVALRGGHRS